MSQKEEIGVVHGGRTYVTLKEASRVSGLPARTLADRIERLGIQRYKNPQSHRESMILATDFAKVTAVQPFNKPVSKRKAAMHRG